MVAVQPQPDRDTRHDDQLALEEIRLLFARYRQIARHGQAIARDEPPEARTDTSEREAVLPVA